MINYNSTDFLEFLDTEERLYEEDGTVEYTITLNNITLVIFISDYSERVYFRLASQANIGLVTFNFEDIESIVCDNNQPDYVRFLVYKYGNNIPVVTASIQPTISLNLDISHKKNIDKFSY